MLWGNDPFSTDAFSAIELTKAINAIEYVPGQAGQRVFAGVSEGVATTRVAVESREETLRLIPTSARGGPAPQEVSEPRKVQDFDIPHIKLEDTVLAESFQNVRQFGTNLPADPMVGIRGQLDKMARRHDFTLEAHRLGALKGQILDADQSVLLDAFATFNVLNSQGFPAPETFSFRLDDRSIRNEIRTVCHRLDRAMRRVAKAVIPTTAKLWGFAGDDFFDALVSHPNVKNVWDGHASAEEKLGADYSFGVYEFANVYVENYRGSDDNATIAIAPEECRFFWTGVPGLYAEYFAPADFLETVNTLGLPRYAKIAAGEFNRQAKLHTQQNPLPLCLRPQTLMRGTLS